jgi:hypothetical protein
MNKLNLSKDLQKYCASFLSEDEKNYSENKWRNFPKKNICEIAAKNGWLDLLQWVRKNGCDWNSWTCAFAAEEGHLEILKWARQNGCEWDSRTCTYAADRGHLEILKWVVLSGLWPKTKWL